MFSIGDRVFLRTDPMKALGTVRDIMAGRYFVSWDNGRTWIYPASWLEKIS